MTAKELRELREKLNPEIKRLRDKNADTAQEWSAEDQEAWDKLNADYNELEGRITRAEQIEAIEASQTAATDQRTTPGREDVNAEQSRSAATGTADTVPVSSEERLLAMNAWFRSALDRPLDPGQAEAAERCGLRLGSAALDISIARNAPRSPAEARALSALDGSAGGFTAPDGFVNSLEENLLYFSSMRDVAEIIRTADGNPLPWPTADDTTNTGEFIGESKDASTEADPTMGVVVWNAYKSSSKMVKVPFELLRDSAFDIAGMLGRMLGTRLGRIQQTRFTTGTGNAQPNGLVTASTLGVTAASATAISFDEMIDLEHSVDPAYRNQPGAGYMMHDNTLKALRQLKDGEGRYLWQPGTVGGVAPSILSHPFHVNNDMASSIAASAKTVLFGSLSHYKIRDVGAIRIRRLVERYAENDQEAFIAFMSCDGNLLDAGTAPVNHLIQHA